MAERIYRKDVGFNKSRRDFLARLVGVGGAVALSALMKNAHQQNPETITIEPPTTSQEITPSGVTITINKEGLPLNYRLPNEALRNFNVDEMRSMKDRAMQSGEPEIIDMVRLYPGSVPWHGEKRREKFTQKNSEQHPPTPELPRDVLPEAELQKRGISILQAESTKLYIREGAFVSGEPLSAFNSTGRKLTIALLDTPVVSEVGLTSYKYNEVRHRLSDTETQHTPAIQKFRQGELFVTVNALKSIREAIARQTLTDGPIDKNTGLSLIEHNIFLCKQQPYLFNLMSDSEALTLIVSKGMLRTGLIGGYFPPSSDQGLAVIFLAVGSTRPAIDAITFYFTPRGEFKTKELSGLELAGNNVTPSPTREQSYPDPKDFVERVYVPAIRSDYYPYGPQTAGQSLRHEVAHDKLIMQTNGKPNFREYDTDIQAMKGIEGAWEKWVNSGFRDNSGYYFVFSLPEGGYILTQNQQPKQTTAKT